MWTLLRAMLRRLTAGSPQSGAKWVCVNPKAAESSLRTGSMPAAIESCWHGGSVLNKSNHLGEKSWWFSKIDIKFPHFEQCQQSQGSDTEDIHIANQSEHILIPINDPSAIHVKGKNNRNIIQVVTCNSHMQQPIWCSGYCSWLHPPETELPVQI